MNIHDTITPDTPDGKSDAWYDGKFYKSLMAFMVIFRWIAVLAVIAFGAYIYQRDTNQQQVLNVTDVKRDQDVQKKNLLDYQAETKRQFDDLRKDMLTRELYEAYRKADVEKMDRIEAALERMANRP